MEHVFDRDFVTVKTILLSPWMQLDGESAFPSFTTYKELNELRLFLDFIAKFDFTLFDQEEVCFARVST